MQTKRDIEAAIEKAGFADYKWIDPKTQIYVMQWVRFHCMFGCNDYGKGGACPPAVPSIAECREMIGEYERAVIIHERIPYADRESYMSAIADVMDRQLRLERELFLCGCYKAFIMLCDDCHVCSECRAGGTRMGCANRKRSRPSVEAMGIDVYKTARDAGYTIQPLVEFGEDTNRYSILLID